MLGRLMEGMILFTAYVIPMVRASITFFFSIISLWASVSEGSKPKGKQSSNRSYLFYFSSFFVSFDSMISS